MFLDPDNGLETPSASLLASKGPKYAALDEMRPFLLSGKSVVVYHHAGRVGTVAEQAQRRLKQIREVLNAEVPIALRYRRGTTRLYFVIPSQEHRKLVLDRVSLLLSGPWSAHFSPC